MTENLLQKLEEKMMALLSEVEDLRKIAGEAEELRKSVDALRYENTALKTEKDHHSKKLQDLIALLDSIYPLENFMPQSSHANTQPILIQG